MTVCDDSMFCRVKLAIRNIDIAAKCALATN